MDAPPPYNSGPKKSNVGLIIGIILGVVCVCCILPIIGIGGLGFWGFGKLKGMLGCSLNFSNYQAAIQDYADAHGGKLPKAETWQTDIQTYYQREVQRHSKTQQMFGNGDSNGTGCANADSPPTGISFNAELSGKKISDVKDSMTTILLFEVPKSGSNLSGTYKSQAFTSSPMAFGKNRGWYVCPVAGKVQLVGKNGVRADVDMSAGGGSDN